MLDLFLYSAVFAGGYVASIYSWPQIRLSAIGLTAEITKLRSRAASLEDQIKENLKGGV